MTLIPQGDPDRSLGPKITDAATITVDTITQMAITYADLDPADAIVRLGRDLAQNCPAEVVALTLAALAMRTAGKQPAPQRRESPEEVLATAWRGAWTELENAYRTLGRAEMHLGPDWMPAGHTWSPEQIETQQTIRHAISAARAAIDLAR